MKAKLWLVAVPVLMIGVLAVGLLPGCEVGSPDNVVASANGSFSGTYVGVNSNLLVTGNSGAAVTSLTLSQNGNQLQAVDNNGILFKGTIGDILNASATFTLNGATTAGQTVSINGNLRANGTTAIISGIWTEPTLYGAINGTATIGAITNAPAPTGVVGRIQFKLPAGLPLKLALCSASRS